MLHLILPFFLIPLILPDQFQVSASIFNVTVDDSSPDPLSGAQIVYTPPGIWQAGQNCSNCTARPDPTGAMEQTWHDSYHAQGQPGDPNVVPAITFQFQGTALYVYCILGHSNINPISNSDMSFFLDGQFVGSFFRLADGGTNFDFNVPVYVNTSIPDGTHTFVLQNGHIGDLAALVLFDYFVYT
ncbi:hypothetical protein C8Q75DRAFT_712891 [Abortiporus biennis]|nr:hypothetical protein C8Q75DRAFT_712891 [Abortiporus biennis]